MTDRLPKKYERLLKKDYYQHYKLILSTLFANDDNKFNTNKIYETLREIGEQNPQTGLAYKQNTLDALKILENAKLVEKIKVGKQKEIINLTDAGKSTSRLILDIDQYSDSFSKLMESMNEKIFCINDDFLMFLEANPKSFEKDVPGLTKEIEENRQKLIDRGWLHKEIDEYNQYRSTLVDIKNFCDKNFVYMILYIYSNIIKEHNLQHNDVLRIIIKRMITEHIENKIDFIIENYEKELRGYYKVKIEKKDQRKLMSSEQVGNFMQFCDDMLKVFSKGTIPSIMKEEVSDIQKAFINLLKDRNKNVEIIFEGTIVTFRYKRD